ncbi:MAG: hypothetical protein IKM00_02140, partial [Clostridia bacterium]|nr:hypothetical protein [Clostridia bacterium]
NQIRRRAMYGVVINCDTAATISGDSPLFYFLYKLMLHPSNTKFSSKKFHISHKGFLLDINAILYYNI